MFTSLADYADYIWLAARTDPDAPKHAGISIFMVDTKLPGFKLTPIWTMAGVRTNTTYFEDVRVPTSMLVGGENMGWSLIVNQLNHERIALMSVGPLGRMLEETRQWAQADAARRRPARHRPAVGAAQPRPRARQVGGAAPAQLAPGVVHDQRRRQLRRRLDGQGLRQRVLRRGLPRPDGGASASAA